MLENLDSTQDSRWLRENSVLDDRYKVLKLIKAGGMGAVYQAADMRMENRIVAIKHMLDNFSDPQERRDAIDRFVSEIQVLTEICHPNIPHVSDHFLLDNAFFFVMDYIEGKDLSYILKNEGSPGLPEKRVLEIGVEVCEALNYIHNLETPFAHRDIKPSNIIIRNADGRVMLIDFGIARVTNPSEGFWIGTPGYAPPEQQFGKPELRSDIYALGAAMHELLTGHRPVDFDFLPFSEFGVSVSKELENIIFDALNWNPDDRIQTALDFQKRLIDALGYSTLSYCQGDAFAFTEAVNKYKSKVLDSLLNSLLQRYANECHTSFIPKNLDYLTVTLACPMSFQLIVKKNEVDRKIEFFKKEGILSPAFLGKIDPLTDGSSAAERIIDVFVDEYERFKAGSWGIF